MAAEDIEWGTYGDSFAHRVKTLRKARKLSQERLAQLADMHRNQISNIERNVSSNDGFSDPHLSTVFKLAAALQVEPNKLIPDADRMVAGRSPEQESVEAVSAVERALLDALEAQAPETHGPEAPAPGEGDGTVDPEDGTDAP